MKNYVLASHNHNETRAYYYKGMIDGTYMYVPNVNEALRFDIEEIVELIAENSSLTWLGFSVVRIEDCTFDKLQSDKELQQKYTDFLYVAR